MMEAAGFMESFGVRVGAWPGFLVGRPFASTLWVLWRQTIGSFHGQRGVVALEAEGVIIEGVWAGERACM
jgi:hypothetical protein